ncbi:hypothetical protein CASFOL_010550 [Castilleja foliolosa]|uniref:Transmembrane protein n=1 Tax=Castilleja foliolosa TaxID=1961234 RepID=A0ABD3DX02_9LAMI
MGFLCSITLLLLSLATLQPLKGQSEDIKSARLLDLVIRDYLFRSHKKNFRTGKLYNVNLPSNLSGIDVDTARFRCGSLRRYGAKMKEFYLGPGTHVQPCSERIILVRQNLGSSWSSLYNDNYELTGYTLVSPVLGLLAYNPGCYNKSIAPEVEVRAGKSPITVDFGNAKLLETTPGIIPLCAGFDENGKITLSNQARPNVCVATRHGHFGLVVESPLMPMRKRASKMKIAMGSSIGVALGAFLLSLLVVAMFVKSKKKKKARMEEMERRAYEEEALQVSMVGHVRAVTASGTRTMPRIEHFECRNQPDSHR